ncbi:unnamed protein product [Ilex paraguariensis]|uniref:Uncharacterized protein n=1 Tax=Ilex paraguariensis TaxID=185542 RepID=A0ABC8T161_9AQUA
MSSRKLASFNESHVEKLAQLDNSKVETNQNGNEWLDKFPVTQHTEALDIEEGQIITEAINVNPVKKICASADVGQISDVKKLNGEKAKNGYAVVEKNNPRILELIQLWKQLRISNNKGQCGRGDGVEVRSQRMQMLSGGFLAIKMKNPDFAFIELLSSTAGVRIRGEGLVWGTRWKEKMKSLPIT